VCVPINPALIDEFDPEVVPTVSDLLNELDHLPTTAEAEDSKARRVEGTHNQSPSRDK
jgi:DNA primase small subunit